MFDSSICRSRIGQLQSPAECAGATLSVSHVRLEMKQPEEVFRGCRGDFFRSRRPAARPKPRPSAQPRPAHCACRDGRGSQPRRVGFNQKLAQRQTGGHVAQRLCLFEGQIASKREQKAQVKRAPRLLLIAAEAVHHAAQSGPAPVRLQNRKQLVPGVGAPSVGRQWMRMGRFRVAAISNWRMNPARCTSWGAPS